MEIANLSPEERRQIWELLKQRTGLNDQELTDILLTDARTCQDDDLARFANPNT